MPIKLNWTGSAICATSRSGSGEKELFRFSDEARLLREVCLGSWLFEQAESVFDPFCGVGQFSLSVPRSLRALGSDVSPRAISYAKINARINLRRNIEFLRADVSDSNLWRTAYDRDASPLIASNPPFGPTPVASRNALHSAAGWWGDRFILKTLSMGRDCLPSFSAALLGIALCGDGDRNSLVERVREQVGLSPKWLHCAGESFWRLGARRQLKSPASLRVVPDVSGNYAQWGLRRDWQRWTEWMQERGYERLEYGVLVIRNRSVAWKAPY